MVAMRCTTLNQKADGAVFSPKTVVPRRSPAGKGEADPAYEATARFGMGGTKGARQNPRPVHPIFWLRLPQCTM